MPDSLATTCAEAGAAASQPTAARAITRRFICSSPCPCIDADWPRWLWAILSVGRRAWQSDKRTHESPVKPPALPQLLIARLPFHYGWVILAAVCCAGFARQGPAVATL